MFRRNTIKVMATTILAPEEIPSTKGPAMGLRKKVCRRNPDSASAPPRIPAVMIRGRRMVHTMSIVFSDPSRRKIARAISPTLICTFPELMFTTVITRKATAISTNTMAHRRRRRAFSP